MIDNKIKFNILYRILQDSVYLYYQAVVALGGTIFKSNIWTCWLLLNKKEIKDVFENLLTRRDKLVQEISAKFWDEI
jgi:hypothetical protein